jgi:hypothetical protein
MFFNGINLTMIAIKVVFVVAWSYFLGFLCRKGYGSVSWFLVLLPFVIMLLGILGITTAFISI